MVMVRGGQAARRQQKARRNISYVPPKAARAELPFASPPTSPAFLLRDPPSLFFGAVGQGSSNGAMVVSPQRRVWGPEPPEGLFASSNLEQKEEEDDDVKAAAPRQPQHKAGSRQDSDEEERQWQLDEGELVIDERARREGVACQVADW